MRQRGKKGSGSEQWSNGLTATDVIALSRHGDKAFHELEGRASFVMGAALERLNCISLFELGAAIMLGKPIYALLPRGRKPPKTLLRVLDGYEWFDLAGPVTDAFAALRKLHARANKATLHRK